MNDEDNKPAQQPAKTPALPPQSSPTDTSNWDDRAFVAPDGKVHIENDTDTITKPVQAQPVINQNNAEPRRKRKIRLVMKKQD